MNKGMLRIEGESVAKEEEKQAGSKQQEDVYSAAGNKIDVKRVAALSDKDKQKAIRAWREAGRRARRRRHLTRSCGR